MNRENLLYKLRSKKVDIEKMISDHEEFVSESYGCSHFDGGCTRYSDEQMKVLFATVPEIFPDDWNYDQKKCLTRKQSTVLGIIHNLEGHPAYNLNLNKIPKIISLTNLYAEGRIKQER